MKKFLDEKEEALRKRILLHRKTKPRPNPFSSQLLTIVVEYVSPFSILNNNHEASIKSNIEKAIGEQTAYTCLEKERLDSIVFEASLENDFSVFLSARFHLFIAMDRDDKKINLVMRLVDKTRIGCDQWTVTIEEGFISKQQKLLIEQLIKTLNKTYKAQYPLKTTVKEVDDNGIIIDIGELHGVKSGQKFQTLDKKYVFDIFSLEEKQCILVSKQPKIILEKGDRLRTLE
ncbi:MAG: hypothetical protein OMM_04130 [Candidatus Magnetoglobus multicellularis str. Araruama]|uniref:Uncharacterized protein n=1 Tax=Candidatus Magnetoglobus multicellularis str. Araruama TaxID=890399 RepID=A0A1V1P302_9BACT|nr:MAG: hypothetical protein OMM_04130 [Candidatus Magnetoglobus multicellularis str. Araruama]